jgi:hypothetical protein
MHTSLIMVALLGPGELSETQTARTLKWQDSYSTARQMGRQQGKPLAVFIGKGPTGWKKVAEEGDLSKKAKQLLAESYICLYVDRTRAGGEQLAESFEVPSGPGLVLSSRDGKGQVFFHAGPLTDRDVETRLAKYTGAEAITRTEMLVEPRVSFAYDPTSSGSAATGGYPAMQQYASPSFNSSGFGGGFGGGRSGGGC